MNVTVNQKSLSELKAQLTPLNVTKVIFGTLISLGAAAAVFAILRNPLKASKGIIKILMAAGVIVLASKAGDVAEEHFKETVDNWAETLSDIKNEINEEGAQVNGNNTDAGRNSKQQSEKQGAIAANSSDKTSGSTIRWRWWGQKKGTEQVLEVVPENVPKRSLSS